MVVTDVENYFADDVLDFDHRVRRDLAGHDHHAGLGHGFARYAAAGLLRQNRVEDRIGDLIRHFVRMAFAHGLRRKQI